ncbi:MAG: hypothetical protein M3Y49_16930, partial [Actinomycetota bacterium]|nr:hypothetical protein [Actinomycetota bacterium]
LDRLPSADSRDTQWVVPDLVADLSYHGLSEGGRLRQPVWRGIRADLRPVDLVDTNTTDINTTDTDTSQVGDDG